MEYRIGVTKVEADKISPLILRLKSARQQVFTILTGEGLGRKAFFDAVRSVLPLDPPVMGSRSWDALSDSLWEGILNLHGKRTVIWWPDAEEFKERSRSDYNIALEVLQDVALSLADPIKTNGKPKRVSIFVASSKSE
ncbi:barstar family protein [Amycolatopsis sp. WGS_07]|uniref:barstar family protein n=1 Tax=Amycolatopsis sp. WGS_07 TaxID=3076764 RepID=UPI0038731CF3